MARTHPRGEYESLYVSLFDGADFQALDPDARLVLLTLRFTLGRAAIAVVPAALGVLAERTGLVGARLLAALEQLESRQWIARERNVIWVIRGLAFQPHLSPQDPKHRAYLHRLSASLPRLAICRRFREQYAEWFDEPEPDSGTSEGASEGLPSPSEGPQLPLGSTAAAAEAVAEAATALPAAAGPRRPLPALDYATRAVIAANYAIERLVGGAFKPLVAQVEQETTVAWERDGIPIELVERVLADVTQRYRSRPRNRQPASLRYYDQPLREAFEKSRTTRAASPAGPVLVDRGDGVTMLPSRRRAS